MIVMGYINYNGNLILEERAPRHIKGSVFRFEKGLFESLLVINREPQLVAYHFERIYRGLQQLHYVIPCDFNYFFFEQEILKVLKANTGGRDYRVRYQVKCEQIHFFYLVEAQPIDEKVYLFNDRGLTLGIVNLFFKEFNKAGNLKTINIPLYKDGVELAKSQGWDDILLAQNDRIIESGGANIFWVKSGNIFTPPLEHGCIEGTMRKYLFSQLTEHYVIQEKELTEDDLINADEVFLTNAVRRIKWVRRIGQKIYSNQFVSKIHSFLFC